MLWAFAGCSGTGPGAEACVTIEEARCARTAECEGQPDGEEAACRRDREAACKAGASPEVREMSEGEVDQCATAIRDAACEALEAPATIVGCEALDPRDAGQAEDDA